MKKTKTKPYKKQQLKLFKQPKAEMSIRPIYRLGQGDKKSTAAKFVQFEQMRQKQANLDYLSAVLFPEITPPGSRCPGFSNVPTAATKIELVTTLTTNALGNGLLVVNPVFVPPQGLPISSVTWNNSPTLTGTTLVAGNTFIAGLDVAIPTITFAGQTFPMYQKFRIVGESIELRYIGTEINRQGYFLSAFAFDVYSAGTIGSADGTADRYTVFTTIRQATWSLETANLSDNDGVRILYIPLDPTHFTFLIPNAPGLVVTAERLIISAVGLFPNSPIEVKRTFHIEWLVDAIGSQFVPVEMSETSMTPAQQSQLHSVFPKMANARGAIAPESNSSSGLYDALSRVAQIAGPIVGEFLSNLFK